LIFKALGSQPRKLGERKTFAFGQSSKADGWRKKIIVSGLGSYGTINGNEVFVARNPGAGQWVR
jgi:hypothetical protein